MGRKEVLLQWFTNVLIKCLRLTKKQELILKANNQQMNYPSELLGNLSKSKVYLTFKNNNWDADFADTQLISKYDKGYLFLLCVIDALRT